MEFQDLDRDLCYGNGMLIQVFLNGLEEAQFLQTAMRAVKLLVLYNTTIPLADTVTVKGILKPLIFC